jgi:penicillin-binding protein 1A
MRFVMRILAGLAALAGLGIAAAAGAAFLIYQAIVRDLPDLRKIDDYRPPLTSVVYDRDGRPMGEFYEERRRLVRLEEVPRHVILAFVAGEDDKFFEHSGIDVRSIFRAAWADLTAGGIVQGGSTITQQTVKSLLLTPERRFDRKLKEMILARRIEQHLSKDEILSLYLNQIYFGSGAWGIGEAARTYFGKSVDQLTVGEGALLAGLPKAPSKFSPNVNPQAAEDRRRYVLGRMRDLGFIDEATWKDAVAHPPRISGPKEEADYPAAAWFTEEVRRTLFDRLGSAKVLRGGLRIETTCDLHLQEAAQDAVRSGLVALDHREGWNGPVRHVTDVPAEVERLGRENQLEPSAEGGAAPALGAGRKLLAVVTSVSDASNVARVAAGPGVSFEVPLAEVAWARHRDPSHLSVPRTRISQVFSVGDVVRFQLVEPQEAGATAASEHAAAAPKAPAGAAPALQLEIDQTPAVQGALVSLDVASGDVLSLVGGYDYQRSQFDRAVQARRQPGSAFKPFIYAAALQRGFTALTTVYDTQVVYTDPVTGQVWKPENYEHRFLGPVPLREALARSLNNATVHVLFDVGIGPVVRLAHALGIRSPIDPYPSVALGTSPVTPLELTVAYAAFPAGGQRVTPIFIHRVLDRDGKVLLQDVPLDEDEPEAGPASGGSAAAAPAAPATEAAAGAAPPSAAGAPSGSRDQVIDPAHAFLVTDLLRAPIELPGGTGSQARVLGRPLGGKTGTTNDEGDAWFVGFSPDIATGVWVGFDERQVLGKSETGARAALPIWIDYMRTALADQPVRDFPVPEGVSYARVDPDTGKPAVDGSQHSTFQAFLSGTEPSATPNDSPSEDQSRRVQRLDF